MFKKIFNKIFRPSARRSRRQKVEEIHDLLFFTEGKGFKLYDMSDHGIAFKNEHKIAFTAGQVGRGQLEFFGENQPCEIQYTVARIQGEMVGCEVKRSVEFKNFYNDFSSRVMMHKYLKKDKT